MCAFVKDRIGERWIYDYVRKIYDIRSSSEDSLDENKNRDKKSSITNFPKTIKTTSLFIDRIKNDFQRDDDFVPSFRAQRNWYPKFTAKYLCETKIEEKVKSFEKSVSKSLVNVAPKIYSIGLYETKKKAKRKIEFDNENYRERVVDYLKRCSFLTNRSLPQYETNAKKWMPNLFSSSSMSIPSHIPIPIEFRLPSVNEKIQLVRSDPAVTDDSIFYSLSQQSFFDENSKFDENEFSSRSKKKLSNSTFISEQFITNEETFKIENPFKELSKDFSLDEISSLDSSTSKCEEFFSPLETTRKVLSDDDDDDDDDDDCSENGILEDIRKRIDKDFDRITSSKIEVEDLNDFCYSDDSSFFDKTYFDYNNEIFLDPDDDTITSTNIEQSKSVPIISSNKTHYQSSKSVTLMSSTLVQNDFSDQSSSYLSITKNTIEQLHDIKDRSLTDRSSINSTIYYDYNYDFPLVTQESMIFDSKNDKNHLTKSYPILENIFSIPIVTCRDKIDLSDKLNLSRTKLNKTRSLNESLTRQKLSEHLIESIDSGVMTDYSRNDLNVCGNAFIEKNVNVSYVPKKQQFNEITSSYSVSDSICSDDSLDRRINKAVQKCTKDLIILERKINLKLRNIGNRLETSRNNLFTLFDWFSEDECIGNISTPSLVSLTDSEISLTD